MKKACICKPSEIMVFACSGGGANVGQISNSAALEITRKGKAKMYCLAGLGGHVPGIIEAAKQARKVIVVDGCPVSCAKKMVEHVGIDISDYIIVTEEGIEKTPGRFEITGEEVQRIARQIESAIGLEKSDPVKEGK